MLQLKERSGFTLIELLVVIIIVAVLAAVGLPLLSGNVERARTSEASAGLGTIRTALRSELAEHGAYNVTVSPGDLAVDAGMGINPGDLTGRFFEDDDYVISAVDVATFCADTTGDTAAGVPAVNTAARGIDVNGISRSMDHDGHIYDDTGCAAGTGTVIN